MRRNQFLYLASILSLTPGLVLISLGQSEVSEILAAIMILLALAMIPFGLLTRGGITKFAWLVLAIVLFSMILASGYLPLAGGFTLGFGSGAITVEGFSVLLVELGVVFSMMYGNYKNYHSELKKAGYDEDEFNQELSYFDRFLLILILVATGSSVAIYFFFTALPAIGLDALTGLVIAGVIYFVIARYVLAQRKTTAKVDAASSSR